MDTANADIPIYRQRPHPLAAEVEFRIENGLLSWSDKKGRSGALRLSRANECRITYDPSRLSLPRWVVDVRETGGQALRFTSSTLLGGGGFRSRNSAFLAFLAALHENLHADAKNVSCHFGPTFPSYVLRVLLWWLPVLGMGWAAYLGFTNQSGSAGVFFAFITLYAGQFAARYSYYNKPRRYPPAHPPLHLLPQPTERDV